MIAYSSQAKNELARQAPKFRCCARAELLGFVQSEGRLRSGFSGPGLEIACFSAAGSRKVYRLLRSLNSEREIEFIHPGKVGKRNHYTVGVGGSMGCPGLLEDLGIGNPGPEGSPELIDRRSTGTLLSSKCCKAAYVRGLFISRGYAANPERGYHLEFNLERPEVAPILSKVLKDLGIRCGIATHNRYTVVYVKGADDIGLLFSLTGAHSAVLDLENVRIVREMRNDVNRLVNCETANVDKTVRAAMRQLDDIHFINQVQGVRSLPARLREVAYARIEHPYASLDELAELLSPRLTKSGINHRMRQLSRMARALRAEHGEE